MKKFFAIVLTVFAISIAGEDTQEEPTLELPESQMSLWNQVTALTMSLKYDEAMEKAKALRKLNDGVGCVLENVVRISMYDDLGDTLALIEAGNQLELCEAIGLWEALRKFEFGYVQTETGHSVKGAMTTRSAAKMFKDSEELDAKAFYAIYAYYIDQSFSWLPFKSDNRSDYLKTLDMASDKSSRFWPLFLTPLVWMYYDKEDYEMGVKLCNRGLEKAPNHPVLLQMKADMYYRLKNYKSAAALYESSALDYKKRTGPSIRYWCAVLNLIRIYTDAGELDKAKAQREKLADPQYKELENWMPSSLMKDLKKRDLL